MGAFVLLLASFAVILAGALLFTNAVEWAGQRLYLGQGAVGSLLAAVGTAMPETLIPVVAVIEGEPGSEEVAVGAIVGAPFLLATIAMTLVGLSALGYRRRREQGTRLAAHVPTLDRDLVFFLCFFALATIVGMGTPQGVRVVLAVTFVSAYVVYAGRTLQRSGEVEAAESIRPLILARDPGDEPTRKMIALQFVVGLGAMVGGAHLFVVEVIDLASSIGVEPSPSRSSWLRSRPSCRRRRTASSGFARERTAWRSATSPGPWSSSPPWRSPSASRSPPGEFDTFAFLSAALGMAGGAVAYWALRLQERFSVPAILAWGALYAVFPLYVVLA